MKADHIMLILAFGAVIGVARPAVAATGDQAPRSATSSQAADRIAPYIDAIRKAADPSAAVAAYTRALPVDRGDWAATSTYVRRMIELGVPDMAYVQARDLTRREPDNGLAWAVVADVHARQGDFVQALSEMVTAVRRLPADAFVQRVAAQLFAWYDTQADQSLVSADLKKSLDATRQELINRATFDEAYRQARALAQQANAAEGQAGESASTEPAVEPPLPQPPPAPVVDSGYTENTYEVYPPAQTDIYDYPSNAYPLGTALGAYPYSGSYWWPCEPVFIGSGRHFRHRDFDFDHDRSWWLGRGVRGQLRDHDRGGQFGDRQLATPALPAYTGLLNGRDRPSRTTGIRLGRGSFGPGTSGGRLAAPPSCRRDVTWAFRSGGRASTPARSFIRPALGHSAPSQSTPSFVHQSSASPGRSFAAPTRSFSPPARSSPAPTRSFAPSASFGHPSGGAAGGHRR
jgi:hypothetical protein